MLPPLVFAGECDALKERLGAVARGEAFLLQGGDCAETFADATADAIRNKIKTLLQMAVVLTYGAQVPVVKVGRIAGQFAKPRSADTETRDGVTLPSYRGDAVNGLEFTAEAAHAGPAAAAAGLQHLGRDAEPRPRLHPGRPRRPAPGALLEPGLRRRRRRAHQRYEVMARDIDRALAFMAAAGVDPEAFRTVDLYSSHEALLLDYERALTRIDSRTGLPYDVSGHLVWVGERTRELDGAHVEFAASIRNPVAVKLGPTTTPDDALALVERLDPDGEPGRLTSSPGWAATGSATRCPRSSRRSPRAAPPSRGSATRCTATRSRRRTG